VGRTDNHTKREKQMGEEKRIFASDTRSKKREWVKRICNIWERRKRCLPLFKKGGTHSILQLCKRGRGGRGRAL